MSPVKSYPPFDLTVVIVPNWGSPASGMNYSYKENVKKETKKEAIGRIAKEKMYASWKMYNEKTITIREIKQVCKPRHQVNFIGRR